MAGLGFLVKGHLIGVLRPVQLPHRGPDAELAEHAFHAEGSRFVRHDRHDARPDAGVTHQFLEQLHKRHGGRDGALAAPLEQPPERLVAGHRQGCRSAPALRQISPECSALSLQMTHLRAVLSWFQQRDGVDLVVGDRQVEALSEGVERVGAHLLGLVRAHLALARLAHAVALDRLGQNDGGLPAVCHRCGVGGVDLVHVVATATQAPDLVV